MKKKVVMFLLAGMLLSIAGCESGKTEEKEPVVQVQKEGTKKQEEDISERFETGMSTEETEIGFQHDDTELYKDSKGTAEVPMGIAIDGEQVVGCTIKMPVDCFIAGSGITKEGEEESIALNGDKLESYIEDGKLEEYAFNMLSLSSIDGENTFDFRVYPSEKVTVESEKSYAPDGVSVGTDDILAYAYKDPQATETSHVTFCTTVQINEKMTLMLWYGGSLVDELSVQELGEKLYSLVTVE